MPSKTREMIYNLRHGFYCILLSKVDEAFQAESAGEQTKKKPQDKQSKNYMAKTVYEKPWRWLLFYCHVERWNEMLLHMYMLIK